MERPRGVLIRFLDGVERAGNKLPDPITLFALFALLVVVISGIAASANVSAVHPGTGETITPVNLLSAAGLRRILTEAVSNFAAFPPLGLVIVVIIGVGVTEQSGLISVALTGMTVTTEKTTAMRKWRHMARSLRAAMLSDNSGVMICIRMTWGKVIR